MKNTIKKILCTALVAVMLFSCVSVGVYPSVKAIDSTYSVSILYDYPGSLSEGYLKVWYYPINSDGTITLTKTEHNVTIDNLLEYNILPGIGENGETIPHNINMVRHIDNIPGWPCEIAFYLYDKCTLNDAINNKAKGGEILLKSIKINDTNILANDFLIKIEDRELPEYNAFNPTYDRSDYDAYLNQTFSCNSNDGLTTNWTLPSVPFKYFLAGYNFEEDSLPFENPTHSIPYVYFTNFFGSAFGSLMYAGYSKTGETGTCFGMAITTGSLLREYISLSDITYEYGSKVNPEYINDIWNGTLGHSSFYIDKLNMSVSTYIDYGMLYQFGPWERTEEFIHVFDTMNSVYNDVYDYVFNNGAPVVLKMVRKNRSLAHAVLAVGLKENSTHEGKKCTEIIVNDSNHPDEERSLYLFKDDNGNFYDWKLTSQNVILQNSNTDISIAKPCYMFNEAVERVSNNLTYTLYEDFRLLVVDQKISFDSLETLVKNGSIMSIPKWVEVIAATDIQKSKTETDENTGLYWIESSYDEPLTFSTDETSASFTYSDYNTALSVDLPYETDCAISTTADDYINLETNNIEGKTIGINKTEFNENNEKYVLEINGLASSEITATQTETGLLVTGISDGTVTLTKDDEVIETQEIKDAVGEIEITYDKTGEDEDVELDYHSHSYSSSITTPATHTAEGVETFTCDCGDSYTKPVAKLEGHTHTVTNTVAPTCTKNGLTVYTCACGDSYSETVKAKGHSYGDDGICVNCDDYNKAYDKTANDSENCSHLCHKGGFMGFIWKIVQIFIRLFKTNPVCECGAAHY